MLSRVVRTSSPFSLGNVYLLIFTMNMEISSVSQSLGDRVEASIRKKERKNPLHEGMWMTSGPQWVYCPMRDKGTKR